MQEMSSAKPKIFVNTCFMFICRWSFWLKGDHDWRENIFNKQSSLWIVYSELMCIEKVVIEFSFADKVKFPPPYPTKKRIIAETLTRQMHSTHHSIHFRSLALIFGSFRSL